MIARSARDYFLHNCTYNDRTYAQILNDMAGIPPGQRSGKLLVELIDRNTRKASAPFQAPFRRSLEQACDASGRKVTLIGWSLGGVYARELAKEMPDKVRGVVTLGSPFAGPIETKCVLPVPQQTRQSLC